MAEDDDALNWHGVVHGDADARICVVAGDVDDLVNLRFGDQLLLKCSVAFDPEVDVDAASESVVRLVDIIAARSVNELVKHL